MAEAFDTHRAYLDLTESECFPTDQAERLVALINGAVIGNVATKTDLEHLEKVLKSDMSSLKSDMSSLKSDMSSLEQSLKSDMSSLEKSLKSDMSSLEKSLKSDMSNLEQRLNSEMSLLGKDFENQINKSKLWVIAAIGLAVGLIKALDYILPGGISP